MNNNSKFSREEIAENIPKTTIKYTGHAIRWSLFLIGIYIAGSMLLLILTKKGEFLLEIVSWSVGGFWAFFMGYWGWLFADQITNSFKQRFRK